MVKSAAPCEGTSYEIGGIALVKGARNREAARRYYEAIRGNGPVMCVYWFSFVYAQGRKRRNALRPPDGQDRAGIGFVFQRFNLFPHLSVRDNVTLAPRRVRKMAVREANELAERVLAEVGLSDKLNEFPDRLSGGQQQRVAIARVLAMQPKLILFDEPTSALDPELVGEVLNVMRRLAEQGRTMIIVTHEIEFAGDVADRIIFMADGNIVEAGPPAEILNKPAHKRTAAFLHKLLHRT